MVAVRLILLGGFRACLGQGQPVALPTRKAKALLAYLASPPGRAHPRDQLASLLWSDSRDTEARTSLRHALYVIRRTLTSADRAVIQLADESVALDPDLVDVDVVTFERGVREGTPEALESAVQLYRGELLEGLAMSAPPFEDWLIVERERLRELALEANARVLAHQQAIGMLSSAIQSAVRLLALDPLQEPVHRALMKLYAAARRRGAALRQYRVCADALERQLGIAPEPETRELYQEILRGGAPRRSPSPGPSDGAPRTVLAPTAEPELPRGAPSLIGRATEMSRLADALAAARTSGGRIVVVLGETGRGKSRLVREISALGSRQGWRVLVGRAHQGEAFLPFGPWVDALRAGAVGDAVNLDALPASCRQYLGRLLPEVVAEQPPSHGPIEYRALFESVAWLLEAMARARPSLLVLEDLHWADETSLRLLKFVGHRLAAWPLMLIITAREDELADAPALRMALAELEADPAVTRLVLSPLSREQALELVDALAGDEPGAASLTRLGEEIVTTSEGNPFMIVEMVRAWREEPAVSTPPGLTLPERVRAVIARRLDRLGSTCSSLVDIAATIGRPFSFALLRRASGLRELVVVARVEELVRRRVFHEVGEHLEFAHHVIQQVAVSRLLPVRRRLLHRRVAEALEALGEATLDTIVPALARHYEEGAVWDRAARSLRLAGEQALSQSAYREAEHWLERACSASNRMPRGKRAAAEAIAVRIDLYHALIPLGEGRRAGALLDEAETLASHSRHSARRGWIAAYQTNVRWMLGESERAVASGRESLAIAEKERDVALQVAGAFYLGQVHQFRGEYLKAAHLFREVAALSDVSDRDFYGLPGRAGVTGRAWLALALAELGEFDEAVALADEAVASAEALDHAFSRANAYRAAGYAAMLRGDAVRAAAVLERGMALCKAQDVPLYIPVLSGVLGWAYALAGRCEEAVPLLERAVSVPVRSGHALRLTWLGDGYLLAGRPVDAVRSADTAIELARRHRERGHEAWALHLRGEVAAQEDMADDGLHLRQALALAAELGMRPLVGHCHLALGRLGTRLGNLRGAEEHLGLATKLYRDMDMRYWVQQATAVLNDLGDPEPAARARRR
jgi:DNA-binding SARP family transcriptional activator/tetratricopeptide (TPR) repeat protein